MLRHSSSTSGVESTSPTLRLWQLLAENNHSNALASSALARLHLILLDVTISLKCVRNSQTTGDPTQVETRGTLLWCLDAF